MREGSRWVKRRLWGQALGRPEIGIFAHLRRVPAWPGSCPAPQCAVGRRARPCYDGPVSGLVFAVVSSSDRTQEALGLFCRRLETSTGSSISPVVFKDYAELTAAMVGGRVHVAWSPPVVAIELEHANAAVPVAVIRRGLRAGYHSALITRASSSIRDVNELRDASVAWVDKFSAAGYLAPRWQLRSQGVEPREVFAEEKFLGSHEAVTEAVLGSEVDVGAVYVNLDPVTGKLATAPWLELGYPAKSVRVLLLVGPIPGDLIVASSKLSREKRQQVTAALLSIRGEDGDIARTIFSSTSFEPVRDGHLDLLRKLARHAAPQTGAS